MCRYTTCWRSRSHAQPGPHRPVGSPPCGRDHAELIAVESERETVHGPPKVLLGFSRDTRRGHQHGPIHHASRVEPGYQRQSIAVSVPIRENSRSRRNARQHHDDSVARWGWGRYRGRVAVIVSRVGEIPDTALTVERLRCSVYRRAVGSLAALRLCCCTYGCVTSDSRNSTVDDEEGVNECEKRGC
jgi:hypothetical protein